MPERNTVNQRVQIGDETTPGTGVAADKLLECFSFTIGPKVDVKTYRGTGRRWASTAEENKEWTEAKIEGNWDYQGFTYLVAGAWGIVSATTHAGGTTSKDWVWTPAVSGAITPRTYTIEQGDAVRAHKLAYGLVQGFSYKGTREGFTCAAPLVGQLLQDGITMTASPAVVALAPVAGKHVNLFLDTSSGTIGTTQVTKAFSIEYTYDNGLGPFWALNRSNTSFTGHVDLPPTNTVKILVEADSQGMGYLSSLQAGSTLYARVDAQGPIIETTIHYAVLHDMAIKLTDISEFKDNEGIFAVEYTGEIVEDPLWNTGQSQTMTITNLLTAL